MGLTDTQTRVFQMKERLKALRPTISRIRETTGAASVSFGVLHLGEVVLQDADGWRDGVQKAPANVDTAYVIGSTMKAMIASCCGMLVKEGKLSWSDRLSRHVDFRTSSDSLVGKYATIHDALSHTTGLAQLDLSWYGASGKNLVTPEDLLHVVAHLPTAAEFRSQWSYCNYMYVVLARIIDKVSDCGEWPTFLAKRLLEPLGMKRSRFSREAFTDDNVAEPHYVKEDGTPGLLQRPDLSEKTLMGPAGCLWSSVPDMLKWAQEVMRSIRLDADGGNEEAILKEMDTITAHQAELKHKGLFENTYGYGWSRLSMPSDMMGFMSTNGPNESPLLGQDSERRLMLYHGGQVTGYLTTLCLFPETESAIVVLSNAQALGDASDWTARAIMQEMFQLSPHQDIVSMARHKAKEALTTYSRLMDEYNEHKATDESGETLDGIFGKYCNAGLKLHLDIHPTDREGKAGEFMINGMRTQHHYLEHYRASTLGFPPESREEQERRCMVDYVQYEQLLLHFVRDDDGEYTRVEWVMQPGLAAVVFTREH